MFNVDDRLFLKARVAFWEHETFGTRHRAKEGFQVEINESKIHKLSFESERGHHKLIGHLVKKKQL